MTEIPAAAEVLAAAVVPAAEVPAAEVQDEADDPQYQEPCWDCPDGNILHMNMGVICIKCISTGEEHLVCIHCWDGGFRDDEDWIDMDADEDSDAE